MKIFNATMRIIEIVITFIHCVQHQGVNAVDNMDGFPVHHLSGSDVPSLGIDIHPACWIVSHFVAVDKRSSL